MGFCAGILNNQSALYTETSSLCPKKSGQLFQGHTPIRQHRQLWIMCDQQQHLPPATLQFTQHLQHLQARRRIQVARWLVSRAMATRCCSPPESRAGRLSSCESVPFVLTPHHLPNHEPHITRGSISGGMKVPAASHREVKDGAPFVARTVPT